MSKIYGAKLLYAGNQRKQVITQLQFSLNELCLA